MIMLLKWMMGLGGLLMLGSGVWLFVRGDPSHARAEREGRPRNPKAWSRATERRMGLIFAAAGALFILFAFLAPPIA